MIDFAVLRQPERLAALRRLALANLEPEEPFDRLTRLASVLFSTPIALISFVTEDRQYFKSRRGLPEPLASLREVPLSYSICQYTVASGEPLVVPDARRDPLFCTNLAVTELGAVAYAGAPLITSEGDCLGTFCVADAQPRAWTEEQVAMLRDLAATAITELELRHELADRARIEEALRESEDRFRAMVEQSEVGIALWDGAGRFLFANHCLAQLLGRPEDEVVRLSLREVTQPDDLRSILVHFDRLARGGAPFVLEWRYLRPDGSPIWSNTTASAVRDAKGRVQYVVGIVQDVTHRKKAEAALAKAQRELGRSEEHFRTLIEHTSDIITIVDESGVILYGSPSVERVLGYPPDELVGRMGMDLVHPDDRAHVLETRRAALQGPLAPQHGVEFRFRHRDGSWRTLEALGSALQYRSAGPRAVLTLRDVTERHRVDAALRESEEQLRRLAHRLDEVREEELTRVSREVHDELGHALTALRLDLGWLLPKLSRNREPVRQKADEMLALVNDTIDTVRRIASGLRPPMLEDLGLAAAVEGLLERFANQTGTEIELLADGDDVPKTARRALYRIVQEALTNIARHAQASQARVVLECSADLVLLTVTDDGVGIPPGMFGKRGSLGLVGMRERATAIGADFQVQTRPGGGTIIRVALPRPAT